MIIVDQSCFNQQDLTERLARFRRTEELRKVWGQRVAVILNHPFEVVSAVEYLREAGGSALLIHADTPLETARQMAVEAGCSSMLYERADRIIGLTNQIWPDEPGLLQFSSGTTGKPKLIVRTWQEIGSEIENYNQRLSDGAADDTPLILVPVAHSFGLIAGVLTALARGVAPHVVSHRNPKYALGVLRSIPSPLIYGVPFLFHLMDTMDKTKLRFPKIISSGAPLPDKLLTRLRERADEVWQQYGCTETGCISLGRDISRPEDVGSPLGHIQVFSEPSDHDDAGIASGEIVAVLNGRTVRTRDIGFISDNGNVQLLGRADDLINVSGLKVVPGEVERVILGMPDVEEAVVYKGIHSVWGETVKAMVVGSGGLTSERIKSWCVERLPRHKVPSVITIAHEIPRLPSGKISRRLLQEKESGS